MEVSISEDSVTLSQPALIKKGLDLLNLSDCKPVKTPLTPSIQLMPASDEDHAAFMQMNINFQSYTGMLNYLACRTRPDLAAAVSILCRFNQKPGTKDRGLLLKPKANKLEERIKFYTDATWAEDHDSRISQSGTLAFWKSCPIAWNSKKQKNITISSTESEMNALLDGEQENQWLFFLVGELWRKKLPATIFNVDNKGLTERLSNLG
ncbi:hypothetical protein VP01_5657g1 [Puccinia sorghi]|uniref:Reverse transcriptase Ty1/copia-type domain-containing protein n=1 Tax=Puccinia sorghi TaxID=27349 RepID=A0A0L6UIX7_9BASI|nr:hypothetical protein VP01_5657g1 [Puccinia sorghi]